MKKDLTNLKFGKLTVIKEVEKYYQPNGKSVRRWLCTCECGNKKIIYQSSLLNGNTKSCGCGCEKNRERIMNKAGIRKKEHTKYVSLCSIHNAMKQRCLNPNSTEYHRYGGRGITICGEWLDKENGCKNFVEWALNNGYSDNLTIDRIDNDKGYSPDNCRWATRYEQMANTSKSVHILYLGKDYNFTSLGKKFGVCNQVISRWYYKGFLTGEEILEQIKNDWKDKPYYSKLKV